MKGCYLFSRAGYILEFTVITVMTLIRAALKLELTQIRAVENDNWIQNTAALKQEPHSN